MRGEQLWRAHSGRHVPLRLPWLGFGIALLASSVPSARGSNFVSSLHTNFVVNLDFEGATERLADDKPQDAGDDVPKSDEAATQVMTFAGGNQKFKCTLPSSRPSESPDLAKYKTHFKQAKLAPLKGKCWTTKRDYWSYDVCFAQKIVQYRPDSDVRFILGYHVPDADAMNRDGTVTEQYLGGTDNRSVELHYVCGSAARRTFSIEEPQNMKYNVTVSSPAFCSWREKDGVETVGSKGEVLRISSLLEDLRDTCLNVTQGWWTYEYCFPHTLSQFHLNGNKREPEHILGTLKRSGEPMAVDQVNMRLVRLKPSINPLERRTPPSNHRTLLQNLGGGTVCDETRRPRATTMYFQCPPNWQTQPETRIVNINEGSLCEYDVMIHTVLLCGHQKLLPALPRSKEEQIKCVAQA